MKLKLLTVAAGIALMATAMTAKAQKAYKEGLITYTLSTGAGSIEGQTYFKGDSSLTITPKGPATIKVIVVGTNDYLAVLVDVPVAGIKKAAVATPAELEQSKDMIPELTFTPGTETKQIAGFNCKKVTAKDPKSGTTFDVWVTNDISAPTNGISMFYAKAGGFPVQFATYQMGQLINVTLKSISDAKTPAGTFSIPAGYDRISLSDLQSLGGKR